MAEDVGQELGHGGLLARDQTRPVLDDRDARAEPRQDLRDLAAHGTAAEYERRLGELRRRIDVFARPDRCPVQALDLGDVGDGAHGDDEIAPADRPSVDLESAWPSDAPAPVVNGDALRPQLAHPLGIVEAVRDAVAPGGRGAVGELPLVQTQRSAHRAGRVGVADLDDESPPNAASPCWACRRSTDTRLRAADPRRRPPTCRPRATVVATVSPADPPPSTTTSYVSMARPSFLRRLIHSPAGVDDVKVGRRAPLGSGR